MFSTLSLFNSSSEDDVKDFADRLRTKLKEKFDFTLGQAKLLHTLAEINGYRNWQSFNNALKANQEESKDPVPFTVNYEQYGESVVELLKLAKGDTGGSRVAAQVLLSAYNGEVWQLDITDLCNLDDHYYRHAMNVIHARRELREEPHQLIKDGNAHFQEVATNWPRLNLEQRWKHECSDCWGRGVIYPDIDDESITETCPRCKGEGYIGCQ